jgi:transposase
MLLKTLLNRVHPVKGFVYDSDRLIADPAAVNGVRIEATLRPRKGSRGYCSGCGRRGRTYDTQPARPFDFVPLWSIAVALVYTPRRIDCRHCGVKVEWLPWCDPASKRPMTLAMMVFLATWARRLSWKQTAEVFAVSWEAVFRSVAAVVDYGLSRRELTGIGAIGVDEVAYAKGHRYATLVYQLDAGCRRLLYVVEGRSIKSLLRFFVMLKRHGRRIGVDLLGGIGFVCSDMWRAYIRVIEKKLPGALHILDRYHIVANLNKALDQVRAEEARKLKAQGWDVLKHARWLLLRRRKKLTGKQRWKLHQILQWNLKTVRAYILVDGLEAMWAYRSPTYAGRFLDAWCRRVMRSRIEPIKRVARSLRTHREPILNWFRAKKQYNSGIVEGKNSRVKLRLRKASGFRTFTAMEVALYHELGQLPEPICIHRFC